MNQPLAYIHPDAKIANNVVIEPFATVENNVEIGEGSWIGSNAVIMAGARIGKNCKIYPGAVVSAPPQDLKYKGEATIVLIGENTTIRECVTINRGTALDKNATTIGNNCLLMAYVHVAHDCVIGNNVIVANSVQLAGHIEVQDYAFIGGVSAVHQFVSIGAHVMVSGGSLVRKDVPPYIKAAREPLTFAGVNSVGLRRKGVTDEVVRQIEDIYRTLYVQNNNISKGIALIKEQIQDSEIRREILAFIEGSDKGIIRGMI